MVTKKEVLLIDALVKDALEIIAAFGIPFAGLTTRRKVKMAKAFLAVSAMKPGQKWIAVKSNDDAHRLRSREVIRWMNSFLNENISAGSYDDIRRKDLILLVEAGVVMKAAEREDAKTNDGTRAYALQPVFANVVRQFGTSTWTDELKRVMINRKSLSEKLDRKRELARVPVKMGSVELSLSPGSHNMVQKAVIEDFLPLFGQGAEVLYLGDTEKKNLHYEKDKLARLGFFELAHEKLPDIVAYSKKKNWLFLIEVVDSANPITELRRLKFEEMTVNCNADIVYVTAFANRSGYHKFCKDIAWETEVWIADSPEHMIHLNGDKFLGPYKNN
jgi:type II restriction enzyme